MTLLALQAVCFSFLLFLTLLLPCQCRLQGYKGVPAVLNPFFTTTLEHTPSCSDPCAWDVLKLDMELLHFNISALPSAKPFSFPTPHTILVTSIPSEMLATGIQLYRHSYCMCSQ